MYARIRQMRQTFQVNFTNKKTHTQTQHLKKKQQITCTHLCTVLLERRIGLSSLT